ncbi:hypothetical protein [Fibrobacter sp. UWEL]|uniref:hypothetical protein n=1 Tax=Fibrobacter sp. UWEL TaxID=1896209 RepID=UPI000912AB87|nr:hypothetical protein [Fibrobacter sp. UWEL]SHL35136.1 hypothetical protein SAMN05720468_12324 [Fibrobacter sp. UWEL]
MKNLFKLLPALLAALILTACEITATDEGSASPVENRKISYNFIQYCDVYTDGYTDCDDIGSGYINLYGVFEVGNTIQVDIWTMEGSTTDNYTYRGVFSDSYGSYDLYDSQTSTDRLMVYTSAATAYDDADPTYYVSFSNGTLTLSKARPIER